MSINGWFKSCKLQPMDFDEPIVPIYGAREQSRWLHFWLRGKRLEFFSNLCTFNGFLCAGVLSMEIALYHFSEAFIYGKRFFRQSWISLFVDSKYSSLYYSVCCDLLFEELWVPRSIRLHFPIRSRLRLYLGLRLCQSSHDNHGLSHQRLHHILFLRWGTRQPHVQVDARPSHRGSSWPLYSICYRI